MKVRSRKLRTYTIVRTARAYQEYAGTRSGLAVGWISVGVMMAVVITTLWKSVVPRATGGRTIHESTRKTRKLKPSWWSFPLGSLIPLILSPPCQGDRA